MNKIPTMFERDGGGDRSRVLDKVAEGCEWVTAGEGVARRKLDGTCCLIAGGALFKWREVKNNTAPPYGFHPVEVDEATGNAVGWVPVGDGPDDAWFREAFATVQDKPDGTYELIGPKIQGNPEGYVRHVLVKHTWTDVYADAPRTFDGIRKWLAGRNIEGLVFHHPDGRMAKIKQRDFGMRRGGSGIDPLSTPGEK